MAFRIIGHEPIFFVSDVQRSVDHFARLGFETSFHDETYAFAVMDNLVIHLAFDDGQHRTATIYMHVDDATQTAADWRSFGAQVIGPEDFDYGKREGFHVDPDGNVIRFGSGIPTTSN